MDLPAALTWPYCTIAVGWLPSSPHGFSTDLYFKVTALAKLCCVSSDKLKKISHVSSGPAALLGFLFAIKLFLILTVGPLFAGKIIILSRRRDISLLSHVVSDGLNKYSLHKAHQAGQKGISPSLADLKFRKCLSLGKNTRFGRTWTCHNGSCANCTHSVNLSISEQPYGNTCVKLRVQK